MNRTLVGIDKRQEIFDARKENARLSQTIKYLRNEVSRLAIALTTVDALRAREKIVFIRIDLEKDLSSRETEVLLRIMAGDSTSKMAKRFFISESTVKGLIQHVYTKLDVHNRGGATAAGFRLGLDPDSTDAAVSTPIERKMP